jgi:hypothetical protein
MVTIKDFCDYRIDILGNIYVVRNNKLKKLKPSLINPGYYTVVLTNEMGRKKFYIHRLLATYFIPNPKNLATVNHINGVKTDNSITNLEWLSKEDNNKHAFATGLQAKRENRLCTKINNSTMVALYNDGHSGNFSVSELANKYGLTEGYIRELSRGLYNKELNLIPFKHAIKKRKTVI